MNNLWSEKLITPARLLFVAIRWQIQSAKLDRILLFFHFLRFISLSLYYNYVKCSHSKHSKGDGAFSFEEICDFSRLHFGLHQSLSSREMRLVLSLKIFFRIAHTPNYSINIGFIPNLSSNEEGMRKRRKQNRRKVNFILKWIWMRLFCLVSSVLASIVIFIEQEERNIEKSRNIENNLFSSQPSLPAAKLKSTFRLDKYPQGKELTWRGRN